MRLKNTILILTVSAFAVFVSNPSPAFAQEKSAKGEIKTSGTEFKKAGTSLGSNVKRGRVVRGGKSFGKHVGKAGKHVGKGTAKAGKKTGSAVKKAVTP